MDDHSADTSVKVSLAGVDPLHLLGHRDSNVRLIEKHFDIGLVVRNGELMLLGEEEAVRKAAEMIRYLVEEVRKGRIIAEDDILDYVSGLRREEPPEAESGVPITLHFDKKTVQPRGPNQVVYLREISQNDVVFGIGPAGTGKTFLAVAVAVNALKKREVDRLVLVRPAVEAGEKLGYLPGDLQEKVDPYLRPLYDALSELMGYERLQKFIQLGVVEIVPLAYMRGRTLGRSFVILDEAQNTTLLQMKMFLTRLGIGSRAVVTGDITQIDLPDSAESGLVLVQGILREVLGVSFVYFTEADVVRHRLVKDILRAFEKPTSEERTG